MIDPQAAEEQSLSDRIKASKSSAPVETVLKTDEQVIARVTDGIYRQPASALRELISNAYDADATRVTIKTDAPRFSSIIIQDNGRGMSPDVLAHLLTHIGGSAKRNQTGENLGITEHGDPNRSPNGRRLIGKIGIGLFSVSQLTHTFQIVTKAAGDSHRTVATIAMRQFSDFKAQTSSGQDTQFESGKVKIWRERATDKASHGTTIALTSIRPSARETLQSNEMWAAIEQNEKLSGNQEKQAIEPPTFHIGRVDSSGAYLRRIGASGKEHSALPWKKSDKSDVAFRKLVDSVWDVALKTNPNPRLEVIFDYYLQMVWQLALAVPLPYVDGHIFDEKCGGWANIYQLSNRLRGSAKRIDDDKRASIRKALDLRDPKDEPGKFEVTFDGLKLARPIRFKNLPAPVTSSLRHPLIFIGKDTQQFAGIDKALSGGPLTFEAYLFWFPKIVPREHRGSLIRIHGSTGTMFDSTFMRYQVAENTRLSQITCEIFVSEGLDSALNIDRESFNTAHPHAVYIAKWLHNALTQLATAQKKEASEILATARNARTEERVSEIQQIAADVWATEGDSDGTAPPPIELSDSGTKSTAASADAYAFSRQEVLKGQAQANTAKSRSRSVVLEEKVKALAQVLASYGLLDKLSKRKQEQLLNAIYKILQASEDV